MPCFAMHIASKISNCSNNVPLTNFNVCLKEVASRWVLAVIFSCLVMHVIRAVDSVLFVAAVAASIVLGKELQHVAAADNVVVCRVSKICCVVLNFLLLLLNFVYTRWLFLSKSVFVDIWPFVAKH